jgi:hypothetical protein
VDDVGITEGSLDACDARRRMDLPDLSPLSFACPRCRSQVEEAFYGPCDACRSELRASLAREAHAVEAEAFEPKMNVTPNAVALKDD